MAAGKGVVAYLIDGVGNGDRLDIGVSEKACVDYLDPCAVNGGGNGDVLGVAVVNRHLIFLVVEEIVAEIALGEVGVGGIIAINASRGLGVTVIAGAAGALALLTAAARGGNGNTRAYDTGEDRGHNLFNVHFIFPFTLTARSTIEGYAFRFCR